MILARIIYEFAMEPFELRIFEDQKTYVMWEKKAHPKTITKVKKSNP